MPTPKSTLQTELRAVAQRLAIARIKRHGSAASGYERHAVLTKQDIEEAMTAAGNFVTLGAFSIFANARRDAKDNGFDRDFAKAEATLGELQRSLNAYQGAAVPDASVATFRGHLSYAAGLVGGLEKQAA